MMMEGLTNFKLKFTLWRTGICKVMWTFGKTDDAVKDTDSYHLLRPMSTYV